MKKVVGLRIDVDTLGGFTRGVVPLVRLLDHFRIKATFFIATGQDTPLRGIPRLFSERGFARRILKLRRSLQQITFGRALHSVREGIDAMRQSEQELALHGFHHFDWQLHLKEWGMERLREEIKSGREGFKLLTGTYPRVFGAPGWETSRAFFRMEDLFGFSYASDTRGACPFYPLVDGRRMDTLQIPVTLPTLDEFIALGRSEDLADRALKGGDVYCAHAEFEGIEYLPLFERFIKGGVDKGFTFVPLSAIVHTLKDAPVCPVERRMVPGRSRMVTFQGAVNSRQQGVICRQ